MKAEGCESIINAALPLYVSERREDGGEPNSISILPVLLEESAMPLYRCFAAFRLLNRHLTDTSVWMHINQLFSKTVLGPLHTCEST